MIWKIKFGLWAVAWAGPLEKVVWADSEQLFGVFFSIVLGAECLSYLKSLETHARAFSRLISDGISGVLHHNLCYS